MAAAKIKGKFAVGAAWPAGGQLAAWQDAIGETRLPATVETGAELTVGNTIVKFFTTDLKAINLKPLLGAAKLKPRGHWYAKPVVGAARTSAPWTTAAADDDERERGDDDGNDDT